MDNTILSGIITGIATILASVVLIIKWRKKKDLKTESHYLFNLLDYYRKTKIFDLPISKSREVFRDMLLIKFDCWREHMCEYAKFFSNKKFDSYEDIYLDVHNMFLDGIEKSLSKWRKNDIPEIVISKFNEWHKSRVEMVSDSIHTICLSNFYSTKEEKLSAVFEVFVAAFVWTLIDAEKTIDNINGDLNGIVYKGVRL